MIVEYLDELAGGGKLIPASGPMRWKVKTEHSLLQGMLTRVLGYADFRFADCGWRKAYPKLDTFHQKMLERPSVKVSVPPAG